MSVSVGHDFLVARNDTLQTMQRVSDFMFHHPDAPKCDLTLSDGVFSNFPARNDFLKPPYALKAVGDSVGLDGMVETEIDDVVADFLFADDVEEGQTTILIPIRVNFELGKDFLLVQIHSQGDGGIIITESECFRAKIDEAFPANHRLIKVVYGNGTLSVPDKPHLTAEVSDFWSDSGGIDVDRYAQHFLGAG